MRCALASAVLLLAAAPRLPAAEADRSPADLVRAFFTTDDEAARRDLAAAFGSAAPADWEKVSAFLHRAVPRRPLAPGLHRFATPGDATVGPVRYVLHVPPAYEPHAEDGLPLVVAIHGTRGSGERFLAGTLGRLGPLADTCLVAAPDAPTKGVYRADPVTIEYPLRVLADVRRRANVDADRCVLTGFSKGGYTTWGTALFSPGAWAGAAPMAGWPLTEARTTGAVLYLENVLALPVQAHWGENDIVGGQTEGINTLSRQVAAEMRRLGAKRFEGVEVPGEGHQFTLDLERFQGFVRRVRRDGPPDAFRFLFHRVERGRAWDVRAVEAAGDPFDFDARRVLRVDRPDQFEEARRRLYLQHAFEIRGVRNREANALALTVRNLTRVEVEVTPRGFDLARPVRLTANGRTVHAGPVEVDWWTLLETARRTGDLDRLVVRRIACDVPVRR